MDRYFKNPNPQSGYAILTSISIDTATIKQWPEELRHVDWFPQEHRGNRQAQHSPSTTVTYHLISITSIRLTYIDSLGRRQNDIK